METNPETAENLVAAQTELLELRVNRPLLQSLTDTGIKLPPGIILQYSLSISEKKDR
jgi:hypothetical protein